MIGLSRFCFCMMIVCISMGGVFVSAQDDAPKPPDNRRDGYRQFFKTPENIFDHWEALSFEIEVGKYDFAARYLHDLMEKKYTEAEYASLVDKITLNAIFRLRLVQTWSKDKTLNDQARKEVDELIKIAGAASLKKLQDPERIAKLIQQLQGNPEERSFAFKELYRSGAYSVPFLIADLAKQSIIEKAYILDALKKLGSEVEAPMIAALEGMPISAQVDLIDVLVARGAFQAVPELWFVSSDPRRPEALRKKAKTAISILANIELGALPEAKKELRSIAENYYRGKVNFPDPARVQIWRWDGMMVVMGWPELPVVDVKKANAYYAARYSSLALILDPTDKETQVLQLINAINGHLEKTDIRLPLIRSNPDLHILLNTVQSDLLLAVLDRALSEKQTGVVLAVTRALGDIAELKAAMPRGSRSAPLVMALNYGDRRVEMAAALALLNIPNSRMANASAEVVEVLARALRSEPMTMNKPRVLVALGNEDWRHKVAGVMRDAGVEPVLAVNGMETIRRLEKASDIDAVFIESTLPDPGIHHMLSSIKAESYAARIPIFLAAVPEGALAKDLVDRYRKASARLRQIDEIVASYKKDRQVIEINHGDTVKKTNERFEKELKEVRKKGRESDVENVEKQLSETLATLSDSYLQEIKDLNFKYKGIQKTLIDEVDLKKILDAVGKEYEVEVGKRVDALKKHFRKQDNIRVVSTGHFSDSQAIQRDIQLTLAEINAPALSEEERKDYAERAVFWLARISRGELPGYDARPATVALLSALTPGRLSDQGMVNLAEALGNLSLGRVQPELAAIVMDGKRIPPVRIAAVQSLIKHIQRNGILMSLEEVTQLERACLQPAGEPALVLYFSSLVGALKPGPVTTGKRLLEFPGPVPGFAPPMPMPKDEKPKPPAKVEEKNNDQ